MKKHWFYLLLATTATVTSLTSCSDNNDPKQPEPTPQPTTTLGAYIINTGNWGANNGSIMWYDAENQTVSKDLYQTSNQKAIGDVQDLCVYGSKMYAISAASAKISVLDLQGKLLKEIPLTNSAGQPISPCYATSHNGYVFFSAHDGTVSRMDTTAYNIDKTVQVGDYPEALTCANNKLYVNISGQGKGSTVAVVDPVSMSKIKDITIKLNPYTQAITGEDGFVYVVSNGNYAGDPKKDESTWIYQTLQRINPETDEVEELCNATYIANKGDKMYILYAEYYLPDTHRCFVYDLKTKESKDFIDIAQVPSPGFIAVDPINEDVYIGNQPYGELNEIYVFDKDGNKKAILNTGLYTTGMRFQTK